MTRKTDTWMCNNCYLRSDVKSTLLDMSSEPVSKVRVEKSPQEQPDDFAPAIHLDLSDFDISRRGQLRRDGLEDVIR